MLRCTCAEFPRDLFLADSTNRKKYINRPRPSPRALSESNLEIFGAYATPFAPFLLPEGELLVLLDGRQLKVLAELAGGQERLANQLLLRCPEVRAVKGNMRKGRSGDY